MKQNELALVWILVGFVAVLFIVAIVLFINEFSSTMNYIKSEISRTEGREKQYWECELKALYLSLIPGVSLSKAKKIVNRKHINK